VKLLVKTIQRESLKIVPSAGGGVAFRGIIREPDPASWLVPLIEEMHAAARHSELATVQVDLRELEYANAAAWKCFVFWLKRMADDRVSYRLHFLCNESHRWQSVGMSTLRVFGGDRVQVTSSRDDRPE
jgi:hypothetical protein